MHLMNISATVSHCTSGYNTTARVAAHRTEDKKISKRTREVYPDIVEQRYSMATLERNNEH